MTKTESLDNQTLDKQVLDIQLQHRFGPSGFALNLSASLPADGTIGVFGPSGSGKTTLLRALAGLFRPDVGQISFKGNHWQSEQTFIPAHQRRIGYVFQEPSLFPHLTVEENLLYGKKRSQGRGNNHLKNRAVASTFDLNELSQLFEIDGFYKRNPQELSGGEQQRVALARALASDPELLLLDEPLSALDADRKHEILPFLARLKSEFSIPMVYVTHSADELALLADQLLVLGRGDVAACGDIQSTYSNLSGEVHLAVLLEGNIQQVDSQWHLGLFDFPGGQLQIRNPKGANPGSRVRVRVQARDVSITREMDCQSSILNRLPARIQNIQPADDEAMRIIAAEVADDTGATTFLVQLTAKSVADLGLKIGDKVILQIKSVAILG